MESPGGRPYFKNGANQAVRLPQEIRFPADVKEVRIRKQGDALVITPAISIYIIKRRPATFIERFDRHADSLSVSVMTAAELRFGAENAGRPKLVELVEAYLDRLAILPPRDEAAK